MHETKPSAPRAAIQNADLMAPSHRSRLQIELLEGGSVQPTPITTGDGALSITGPVGRIALSPEILSRHILCIGGIGTGKTNTMLQLVGQLRGLAQANDVFIIFDTKGDYLLEHFRDGDSVISNSREWPSGGVIWNIFQDLIEQTTERRSDEILEIAGTIFEEQAANAGTNLFFSVGARDVFCAVVDAMSRINRAYTNADLRKQVESSIQSLGNLIGQHEDLQGVLTYLSQSEGGGGSTAQSIMAFMIQAVKAAFSGVFRAPGDFSIRRFVQARQRRALFIEYDIAAGTLLLPIYRVLIDLALKEALGRTHPAGNVYFILDEFSLLPQLKHVADGINFGRSLGLKFVVGTQNVGQVYHAYDEQVGQSILSGFGTVFAFRLFDESSRSFVRDRYGANRKLITTENIGRTVAIERSVVAGNVIEDWEVSSLRVGEAIAALPTGAPFFFQFPQYRTRGVSK